MFAGESRKKDLSEFVCIALKDNQVTCWVWRHSCGHAYLPKLSQNSFAREAPHQPANLSADDRALIARILGRDAPDEAEVARRLAELYVAIVPYLFGHFSDTLSQAAESTRL